ncbi:MAG: hypothetical protein LBE34_13940 [Flavobacteriaceae bacterium]|jgi:hypothetical protein|nr:hypothetical protein [Flavobacteriaceae bacterium]
MYYVIMNEEVAVEKGIITATHHFPTKKGQVLFKRDILSNYVGSKDFEFEEITTAQAVKTMDTWQK